MFSTLGILAATGAFGQSTTGAQRLRSPQVWQTLLTPPGEAIYFDAFSTGSRPSAYLYAANPNQPMWNLHQHYFAGTKSATWGSPGGILVGDYWIKYWTDRIDHIRIR